jgi:ELP3 family radical SAM enzyme/protein acetyltransferase
MYSRIHSLRVCGHPADKFEILILGGTIYSYPKDYLSEFMRDIFYAANTCLNHYSRERKTLLEEQDINENETDHRIIGITVETRPDCIKPQELIDFRRYGVTRVQIGVQHTDDEILKKSNRGHGLKQTLKACQMLRDSCFKFDIHLMPNLKGSTPEKDIEMLDYVLSYIHPDQVKLYPTTTTPFTKILEDYKAGLYVPYSNEDVEKVVLYWLTNVHPWIRNNRIIRDIPNEYIIAGVKTSNQKQEFDKIMKEKGIRSNCIRAREPGRVPNNLNDGELVIRTYEAQSGIEYFISWESKADEHNYRETIFGFARLRVTLNQCTDIFPELEDCTLIRELHVYGNTLCVNSLNSDNNSYQHLGIGKMLLKKAEEITKESGYDKICVISGIGTRNYYIKLGYKKVNTFLIKQI